MNTKTMKVTAEELEQLRKENAAQAQEIDELKAHANELREAMEAACAEDMWIETMDGLLDYQYVDWYVDWLTESLAKTPAQSLAAHDAAIEGEAVERCADEVAKYYGSGAGSVALRNMPRKHDV